MIAVTRRLSASCRAHCRGDITEAIETVRALDLLAPKRPA